MNENIDLTKILANVPKGTKLFSFEYGYVEFSKLGTDDDYFPIVVKTNSGQASYTKDGYYTTEEYRDEYAEPSLYPAHDQRDWSKFEVPKNKVKVTLHPFDKVLVRSDCASLWKAQLVTDINNGCVETIDGDTWLCGIPYNKDTAHLLGTSDKSEVVYEIEFSKEFKDYGMG